MTAGKGYGSRWWHRGLSFFLSCALVVATTPLPALADDADAVEEEVVTAKVQEGEPESIEGSEGKSGIEGAEPAEGDVIIEGTEDDDEANPADNEETAAEDPSTSGEQDVTDDAATTEDAVDQVNPVAEDAPEEPDLELTAQDTNLVGELPTDGSWKTNYISGTDVDAYNAAKAAGDSDGTYAALTGQMWRVTMRQAGTLSVDVWSKGASVHWWIATLNNEMDMVTDERNIAPSGTDTQRASVTSGVYYVFVVSDTTVGGNYALRAYTSQRAISRAGVSQIANSVYIGAAQTPAPTVKWSGATLVRNVDYTISYANNKKPGTAKATIVGKGLYSGSKALTFKITKRSIKKVKAKIGTKAWTGRALKPKPTVKIGNVTLKRGVDYKIVKYVNNKKVGTAKVVIKGKGGLTGTRTIKFKIRYSIKKGGSVTGYYRRGTTTFNRFVYRKTKARMKAGRDYRLSVTENSSSRKVYKMVGKGKYWGTTYFTFNK